MRENVQNQARTVLTTIAILAALAFPIHPASAKDSDDAIVSKTGSGKAFATMIAEDHGIPRFAQLDPGLARGGQPSEEGVRYLKEKGYKTVISFIEGSPEREQVERLGMRYVEIPIHSNFLGATPPTEEQVRQFLSIVSDSSSRPVFYHCLRGRDRTGAMTGLYRVNHCGWSPQEAEEEMVAFGYRRHYKSMLKLVHSWPERMRLAQASAATPGTGAVASTGGAVSPAAVAVPVTP